MADGPNPFAYFAAAASAGAMVTRSPLISESGGLITMRSSAETPCAISSVAPRSRAMVTGRSWIVSEESTTATFGPSARNSRVLAGIDSGPLGAQRQGDLDIGAGLELAVGVGQDQLDAQRARRDVDGAGDMRDDGVKGLAGHFRLA